jgi:hypothetical protein
MGFVSFGQIIDRENMWLNYLKTAKLFIFIHRFVGFPMGAAKNFLKKLKVKSVWNHI